MLLIGLTCSTAAETKHHEQQEFLHRNVSQRFLTFLVGLDVVTSVVSLLASRFVRISGALFIPSGAFLRDVKIF